MLASDPDAPDPQDRAVGRARVPEVDAREDRPRVIALRVDEGLRDLPLARAGGLQPRQVMKARLGPRDELAEFVEERRHRGLEALRIPPALVRARGLGPLRHPPDALRRLFPVLLRERPDEELRLRAHARRENPRIREELREPRGFLPFRRRSGRGPLREQELRMAHPLPLFEKARVGLSDERAEVAEHVPELVGLRGLGNRLVERLVELREVSEEDALAPFEAVA